MIKVLPDAYPLRWPDGWKRTVAHRRKNSRYKVKPMQARENLVREIRLLGGEGIIVSSDTPVGRQGRMLLSAQYPDDPGVAVYWVREGKQEVMACDRWRRPWENLQALFHAVQGLRSMERSGATQVVEQAFQAFQLPAPAEGWRAVLGFEATFTPSVDYLRRVARELMANCHPDIKETGDEERFKTIQQALHEALRELET